MRVCACACKHVCLHLRVHAHVCVCVCTGTYVYMLVPCMCVCFQASTCTPCHVKMTPSVSHFCPDHLGLRWNLRSLWIQGPSYSLAQGWDETVRRILVKNQNPAATLVQILALPLLGSKLGVHARGPLKLSSSLVRWGVISVHLPGYCQSSLMSVYRGPLPFSPG